MGRRQTGVTRVYMSDEEEVVPVAEEQDTETQPETIEPVRQVPLEALEAERRKRQELELQIRSMQEKPLEADEDDEEFMTKAEFKRRLKEATFGNKREVLEESFCTAHPEAIEQINKHLETIIKRKPWLAQTIDSAPNRYARAYEIIQDYMPKDQTTSADKFRSPKAEAKKIIENSQKPGSPTTIAKSAQNSNADYLRSIAGKPEFREYRRKMMAGS